jgi:outer membrane protein
MHWADLILVLVKDSSRDAPMGRLLLCSSGRKSMNRLVYVLFLSLILVWPACAQSSKLGFVDGDKLFDEYPAAQDASKKISDAQEALKKEITESERIFTEFEKQKKSEAEKATKQKELQAKIDLKANDTKKLIETLSVKIEDDIMQTIKKVAAEKGLDVILDKRAVLLGGQDITDIVSVELRKKSIANQLTLPGVKPAVKK